jgi:drug/metabolite transporter (DMT)-like permease
MSTRAKSSPRYHLRTALLMAVAVFSQALGNLSLSKGMKSLGSFVSGDLAQWPALLLAAVGSPWIWLGALGLLTFVVLFAATLSWADLSLVLPVASVEIILNVWLASWLLGEPVSPLEWAGTLVIATGVALVASTVRSPAGEEGAP